MPPASCKVSGSSSGGGGGTTAATAAAAPVSGAACAFAGGPAAGGDCGGRCGAATTASGRVSGGVTTTVAGGVSGGGGVGPLCLPVAMASTRERQEDSAATHCGGRNCEDGGSTIEDAAERGVRSAADVSRRRQTTIEQEARTGGGNADVSLLLKKKKDDGDDIDELMWEEKECVGGAEKDGSGEEHLRKRSGRRVRESAALLLPSNVQQQGQQQQQKHRHQQEEEKKKKETPMRDQKDKGEDQQQKKAHGDDNNEGQKGGTPEPPAKLRFCSYSSDTGPVAAGTIVIRPFLRGKIHLTLFCLSPIWIFLLLSACSSTRSIIAAVISSLSFVFNFFASALLHCFEWADRPALKQLLHKLDHAGIFFVISGSTTPIPVLLLDASSSFWLLLVQFVATCYGFVSIIFGDLSSGARKRRAYTYIIVGLLHALFLSEYYRVLTRNELLAISTLSTLYVLGALVYGFKWPDPFPAVYGFHEVFHSFCLVSFIVTVWLDYVVIRRAEWAAMPIGPDAAKTETLPPSQGEMPGMFGEA